MCALRVYEAPSHPAAHAAIESCEAKSRSTNSEEKQQMKRSRSWVNGEENTPFASHEARKRFKEREKIERGECVIKY